VGKKDQASLILNSIDFADPNFESPHMAVNNIIPYSDQEGRGMDWESKRAG
jgi:hypothetical protein